MAFVEPVVYKWTTSAWLGQQSLNDILVVIVHPIEKTGCGAAAGQLSAVRSVYCLAAALDAALMHILVHVVQFPTLLPGTLEFDHLAWVRTNWSESFNMMLVGDKIHSHHPALCSSQSAWLMVITTMMFLIACLVALEYWKIFESTRQLVALSFVPKTNI